MKRPTLAELKDRIIADFEALPLAQGSIARISIERALSAVLTGLADGLYGYLDWVRAQLLPTTGDVDTVAQWGDMLGISPTLAARATGQVQVTGTDGQTVRTGAKFEVDGAPFEATADATLAGGKALVTVIAVDAGASSNKPAGKTAWLVSAHTGIDARATVPGDIGGGADAESTEHYRVRVLEQLGKESRGGSAGDWIAWAKEVSGVSDAWEYPRRSGLGTVELAFLRRGDTGSPIPDAAEVAQVQAHLAAAAPYPIRSVLVWAPTAATVAMTLRLRPNTPKTQAAVTTALRAAVAAVAVPETAIPRSVLSEVISSVSGEEAHAITVPATDPSPGTKAIFTDVAITFEAY